MRVVSHRCPTCGGNMEYDDKKRLVCSYCGYVKLDVLIKKNTVSLTPEYFEYYCEKCNHHEILKIKSNDKVMCPSCGLELNSKKILFNGVLNCDRTLENVEYLYEREIKEFGSSPLYLPKEFIHPKFVLKYIKAIKFNGVIILECNSNKVRYIFKNVIIPLDKGLSYSHLLDFSTIIVDNNKEKILTTNKESYSFSGYFSYDNDFSSNEIVKDLEKACIRDFVSLFYCDEKDININNAINIMDYIYVPFYHAKINYDGKIYNNYVCGCEKCNCYLSFPKLDKKIEESLMSKGSFCMKAIKSCETISSLFIFILLLTLRNYIGFILIGFILIFNSLLSEKVLKKQVAKREYVLYNRVISKENYFDGLINSNVVERRK